MLAKRCGRSWQGEGAGGERELAVMVKEEREAAAGSTGDEGGRCLRERGLTLPEMRKMKR